MLMLQLVSPERMLVEEPVSEVQIPALNGFIGVLPGHAALVSELRAGGVLTYSPAGGGQKVVAVYGGFAEVLPDRVRVLADGAQTKEEIDPKAAQERLVKANAGNDQNEVLRAQAMVEAAGR